MTCESCRDAACCVLPSTDRFTVPNPGTGLSRKSPRASFFEYNEGRFFITVCTSMKKHYFGEIHDCEMHLSEIGKFLKNELENSKIHHPHIDVPLFVVMPNHWHAIVIVDTPKDVARCVPTTQQRLINKSIPLLSAFIRSVKSATTKFATAHQLRFKWQGRFHDHAIRGPELNKIAEYIENNIARWSSDCFFD